MSEGFDAAFARVPDLAASHILLAAAALALGIAVSLPLAVLAARRPWARRIVLGFASLVQTIPGLALLALFYPVLLGLSTLTGLAIPALGFLPSLLALTLYAILPILRNAVTGLGGLDPAMIEAADAVGMTGWQKLRLVEAPLALPVVMAGVRTAAVWTIGAATLSTTVGQPSLGDLIFAGLQTQDWTLVLAGCLASAGLALIADALLGLVAFGLAERRRSLVSGAVLALLVGLAFAAAPLLRPAEQVVTIGAKGFSEQYILARLIGLRLEDAGYRVRYTENLGSAVVFSALSSGAVDVYVDYSGTIWTNEMKRDEAVDLAAIGRWASDDHKVTLLGPLGFENAYAIAVRGTDAARLRLETLDDLARVSPQLTFGADLEFLERPEWFALERAYPFAFEAERTFSPTFMYSALASGQADAISAFSSDGRIAAMKLKVLADTRRAIPAYDAILLAGPKLDAKARKALQPLVGGISVELMREANYRVDRDSGKQSPEAAARWLDAQLRTRSSAARQPSGHRARFDAAQADKDG